MDEWALITGASTGIGRALATVFAEHGVNLLLVARSESRLQGLAQELSGAYKVKTVPISLDLSKPNAASDLFERARAFPVSILVNNAGFGKYGAFAGTELGCHKEMMQLNMAALVELAHVFIKPMLARGHGRILNVASTAAFQPGPMFNIYYATKAFVYSFSYALAIETKGTGVTVTALCPGMTRTEFQHRAGLHAGALWPLQSAREVAEAGYKGLMKGRRVVIPGIMNQIATFFARRLPSRVTSAVALRIHQPPKQS